MRIPTDRYTSPVFVDRERKAIWTRVWQIVGRVDELGRPGDFKEYRIFDQSFVVMRGNDGDLRGFVNACRHRGNVLFRAPGACQRTRLSTTCGPMTWTDTTRLSPNTDEIDKATTVCSRWRSIPSPVSSSSIPTRMRHRCATSWARTSSGSSALSPRSDFHVLDVREPLECNWKVVMDAFEEGYHVSGIHPQLLRSSSSIPPSPLPVPGRNSVAVAPFEVAHGGHGSGKTGRGHHGIARDLPALVRVPPPLHRTRRQYRATTAPSVFPEGVTGRILLQRATRDTLSSDGLDVAGSHRRADER